MNKTQKAFNFAGKSGMYDGVITGMGFFGSLVSNLVWKMNKEKDLEYQRLAKFRGAGRYGHTHYADVQKSS